MERASLIISIVYNVLMTDEKLKIHREGAWMLIKERSTKAAQTS
jgi:hypothetical protein